MPITILESARCIYPECGREREARGLCRTHYQAARRAVKEGEATWEELVKVGKCASSTRITEKSWYIVTKDKIPTDAELIEMMINPPDDEEERAREIKAKRLTKAQRRAEGEREVRRRAEEKARRIAEEVAQTGNVRIEGADPYDPLLVVPKRILDARKREEEKRVKSLGRGSCDGA